PVLEQKAFEKIRKEYPEVPSYDAGHGQVKIPAGWMIERCGWKGKMLGRAGVHDRQALVLINKGGVSGREVLELAEQIKNSVKERFGISLDMEVNIV
ncbi:MAG: hypothetical protein KAT76_07245, partial [Bacteroidales bacterium]|nr:hypothetical protein [Bacteroidales bacterium]